MIWWYRNVFIDRNMPLTAVVQDAKPQVDIKPESGLLQLLGNGLSWVVARYQERAQLRYDWRVYKNLTDHQLEDIGLTRDDLHLLLQNQTPVIPQQRVETVKKRRAERLQTQLLRDSDLEMPIEIPRNSVCSNDCVNKVA